MNPSISLSFDGAGEFNCGFASRNDFNHKSAALVWPRPRLTKVRKPSNGKVKGAQGRLGHISTCLSNSFRVQVL
ncbi:hypothetical protein V6N12_030845 [Hibiscus sabdariffa]|uniref:Uncharacterized protein n=1 Tax=Hibiscus sabdariffa TaxID=183260 RepID=A0ABR2E7M6_9ROSI